MNHNPFYLINMEFVSNITISLGSADDNCDIIRNVQDKDSTMFSFVRLEN